MLFHPEANHRSAFLERPVNQLVLMIFLPLIYRSMESVAKRGEEGRGEREGRSGSEIEGENFYKKKKRRENRKRNKKKTRK